MALPDPDRARRRMGFALFLIGVLTGSLQLFLFFVVGPLAQGNPSALGMMCVGAALAFPAALLYLTVPRLLDRYDPEPWYALAGCLVWGGLAACGFSVTLNSFVADRVSVARGAEAAEIASTVLSAPLVEEVFKGLGVLGVFVFLRREFDGVVDGIIYATFVGLGFAAVENVVYYAEAASHGSLAGTFFVRGILAPWGHPVYTSMTGLGLGLARETERASIRLVAPAAGFVGAVLLHALWNGTLVVAGRIGDEGAALLVCQLLLWLLFVGAFLLVIVILVRRRGRIVRYYLEDEVALGNLTPSELELVCRPFGLLEARRTHGALGVAFVRAAARLALSKWHSVRARNQSKHTVSMDFVIPLRDHLRELRERLPRGGP